MKRTLIAGTVMALVSTGVLAGKPVNPPPSDLTPRVAALEAEVDALTIAVEDQNMINQDQSLQIQELKDAPSGELKTVVVVDATGKVIGTPAGYHSGRFHVNVAVKGTTAVVQITLDSQRLATDGMAHFTSAGCTGEAYMYRGGTGFSPAGVLGNLVYAPDLTAQPVPQGEIYFQSRATEDGICDRGQGYNTHEVYPAIAEVFDVTFPVGDEWL